MKLAGGLTRRQLISLGAMLAVSIVPAGLVMPNSALAGVAHNSAYVTLGNFGYYSTAIIETRSTGTASASAKASTANGNTVSPGYLGAYVVMYDHTGTSIGSD